MCVAIKLLLLLIIVVIVMFLCTVPHSECANKQMYKYSIIETVKNSRHNSDVIMGKMASQITSLKIVYTISLKMWQFNDIINVYGLLPPGNNSLSEPMLTHIYVAIRLTRPEWVSTRDMALDVLDKMLLFVALKYHATTRIKRGNTAEKEINSA